MVVIPIGARLIVAENDKLDTTFDSRGPLDGRRAMDMLLALRNRVELHEHRFTMIDSRLANLDNSMLQISESMGNNHHAVMEAIGHRAEDVTRIFHWMQNHDEACHIAQRNSARLNSLIAMIILALATTVAVLCFMMLLGR
jgi:hypothetical protein